MAIRIGIMGYGNIGKGIETALADYPDMELAVVFTRRNPADVKIHTSGVPVVSAGEAEKWKDKVDVLVLAGGSATDLPEQTPAYASLFNVIDTFDTHAHISRHFAKVDEAARAHGKTAMISVGWDPGLFSLARLFGHVILPDGKDYTFWGRGVSQGHSDAIRRVPGVKDGKQYTCPVASALEAVRNGENPVLTTRDMHTRECYVVAEEGADRGTIENTIRTMPNYFADYDTTVHFISEEELKPEVFIQFQGQEAVVADVIEKAKKQFEAEGHRASSIKSIQVYLKPEEYAAYYVINQKHAGRVDLF